jgi:hypothetical protein
LSIEPIRADSLTFLQTENRILYHVRLSYCHCVHVACALALT